MKNNSHLKAVEGNGWDVSAEIVGGEEVEMQGGNGIKVCGP